MPISVEEARKEVMWGVKAMCDSGYVLATGGNISARVEGENQFVITPSSRAYDTMSEDDLIVVDLDYNVVEGKYKPSVETPMHGLIYRKRPDVKCVIHMHSKFAVAAASIKGMDGIPPISFEMLGYFGGAIPFAPFEAPGSMKLAETVQQRMGESMGIIMQNHGAIGVGKTMKEAMTKCDIIERACEQYLIMKSAGEINPIPEEVLKNRAMKA